MHNPSSPLPDHAARGRGAVSNREGRFEPVGRDFFDDGWGSLDALAEARPSPRTLVIPEVTRSALSRNTSPDIPFEQSLNPYKGCEHGCIYCYARPTHTYLGWSAGLDFETRIVSKPGAPERLAAQLARSGYEPKTIAIGGNTDPYQPVERELRITRRVLEVLIEHRHPFGIITKSAGVLRDLDLLTEAAAHRLVHVMVSVTSLDPSLSAVLEPRASAPARRLKAISELAAAGVPVGVLVAPVIPSLNDPEMEAIVTAVADAGALRAGWMLLRLPLEIADLFDEWLEAHFPLRRAKVLAAIRDMRGGELYRGGFGVRMRGTGPRARLLARRFEIAARRAGVAGPMPPTDPTGFVVPVRPGGQLALFG